MRCFGSRRNGHRKRSDRSCNSRLRSAPEWTVRCLNCAAIPGALLESELFGHERGAFTGAVSQTIGHFQAAHGGTLFLDEIGDLPLELQPKLLRVLQEQQYERLGSSRTLRADVRVIAATNQDLSQMVEEKTFRADLYYRLSVFPIRLPSLRERKDDIPSLVKHFVQKYSRQMGKSIDEVPDRVMEVLRSHHWPGNIRELQNFVERSVIMTHGNVLSPRISELKLGISCKPRGLFVASVDRGASTSGPIYAATVSKLKDRG